MVTAYDAPSARVVDGAGVDMILVGDSLAMVVLGYDDTLQVTTDDMVHHVGRGRAHEAARARRRRPAVDELPRVARGDGPQRGRADPRRRGRGEARGRPQAARRDRGDPRRRDPGDGPPRPDAAVGPRARRLQGAGQAARRRAGASSTTRSRSPRPAASRSCSSACPTRVARMVTDAVSVPTIGIGAGRHCDGQVLVFHDLLGFEDRMRPRFVRRYAELGADATDAVRHFVARRARRAVPVERRDVPHDRPARELDRHGLDRADRRRRGDAGLTLHPLGHGAHRRLSEARSGGRTPLVPSSPIGPVGGVPGSVPGSTTEVAVPVASLMSTLPRRHHDRRGPPGPRRSEGGTGLCGRTRSWSFSTRTWKRRPSGPRSTARSQLIESKGAERGPIDWWGKRRLRLRGEAPLGGLLRGPPGEGRARGDGRAAPVALPLLTTSSATRSCASPSTSTDSSAVAGVPGGPGIGPSDDEDDE